MSIPALGAVGHWCVCSLVSAIQVHGQWLSLHVAVDGTLNAFHLSIYCQNLTLSQVSLLLFKSGLLTRKNLSHILNKVLDSSYTFSDI